MNRFNWQQKEWPDFKFEIINIENFLYLFYERVGHVTGMLKAIPDDMQMETLIDIMVADAIKSSEIEGEFLSRKDVMSSIKKNLGLITQDENSDVRAAGISLLMINIRNTFSQPLTAQTLFDWHRMIMSDANDIEIGKWRIHNEPMQV